MNGHLRMVDVGDKAAIKRVAVATGEILLAPSTIDKIRAGKITKGDVITASKLAGIMAAKRTPSMLPLCHPLSLTKVKVDVDVMDDRLSITAEVHALERTGVEMEALSAVSVALLNAWDMVKMHEKDDAGQYPSTAIASIRVIRKDKQVPGDDE